MGRGQKRSHGEAASVGAPEARTVCPDCHVAFRDRFNLEQHRHALRGCRALRVDCGFCHRRYASWKALVDHLLQNQCSQLYPARERRLTDREPNLLPFPPVVLATYLQESGYGEAEISTRVHELARATCHDPPQRFQVHLDMVVLEGFPHHRASAELLFRPHCYAGRPTGYFEPLRDLMPSLRAASATQVFQHLLQPSVLQIYVAARLPRHERRAHLFSFRNGVWDARSRRFYPATEVWHPTEHGFLAPFRESATSAFIDADFEHGVYAAEARNAEGGLDPARVETPILSQLLRLQGFSARLERDLHVLLGGLLAAPEGWHYVLRGSSASGARHLFRLLREVLRAPEDTWQFVAHRPPPQRVSLRWLDTEGAVWSRAEWEQLVPASVPTLATGFRTDHAPAHVVVFPFPNDVVPSLGTLDLVYEIPRLVYKWSCFYQQAVMQSWRPSARK